MFLITEARMGRERNTHHDIVEVVPRQIAFRHHRGSNQGTDCGAQAVRTVQEAKQLICVFHITDPSIPTTILQPRGSRSHYFVLSMCPVSHKNRRALLAPPRVFETRDEDVEV
jgi:hypothetical protein